MLDKSLPYIDIVMRRPPMPPPPPAPLPEGFGFAFYEEGDMGVWAEIETSVLEFETQTKAEDYFKKNFLPFENELYGRMIFAVSPTGRKIGTATAWYSDYRGRRFPWLHWVAVRPEYQGLGVGRALVNGATARLCELNAGAELYLHTQTWSHKAVLLYEAAGFEITEPDKSVCEYNGERLGEAKKIIDRYRK